jgi:iron complex transport system substrate-binding protein
MRVGRARSRRCAVLATTVALCVLVVGCGSGSGPESGAAAAPDAAHVACAGARTAESEGWVEPLDDPAEPTLPVTVTDFTGEPVTVTDTSRVLALDTYGTLATTVYALGQGERLVGRDISTGVPALEDLPLVTHNGHELNAEAILELDPTLVLTDYSIGPLEVQLQLKDSGIPVVIMDGSRGRDLIGEQIRAVAQVLGVAEDGERLAQRVDEEVAAAEADVAALVPTDPGQRLRMVFLYLRGQSGVYYWFGKGSGADDLIDALGGVDVATEVGLDGSRPINAEGLVRAEPDLFLMMTDGLESVGGPAGLSEVAGVAETPAGVNGCVVDMVDSQILSFGPQFPSTLRALADAVYHDGGSSS